MGRAAASAHCAAAPVKELQLHVALIRDAVQRFAFNELFDPLGMRDVTLEMDATGTPVGAHYMLASARDWARFGLLYLQDGMAGDKRILHEDWVDLSAAATLDTDYGAGFWTNRSDGDGASYRIAAGMPADAFMARGSQGQYVVIVPSQQLVVVRLGPAWTARDDMDEVARLTRDVVDALAGRRSTP